jgi:hypothetical protein
MRTAIAFAALGVLIARRDLVIGLIVLACVPLVWALGPMTGPRGPGGRSARRLLLVTVTVTGVSLLAAAVALFGHSPASLRDLFPRLG